MKIHCLAIPTESIIKNRKEITGIAVVYGNYINDSKKGDLILIIKDLLTPAIVYQNSNVIAFVAEQGSWNSHGVSLALAKNIPCMVGVGREINRIINESEIVLNFLEGTINL